MPLGRYRGRSGITLTHVVRLSGEKDPRGGTVDPLGGWGSHEVCVLADAGPQEHQAPIFSSVKWGRVRSSQRPLCFTLPEEENMVEGWEGERSRGSSPLLSELRPQSQEAADSQPAVGRPTLSWPCHLLAVSL